ncbi:MAG: 50S ribosomal protein L18 [Nanoarchaeota archaeon]
MAKKHTILYRRKSEGRTDYKKRISFLKSKTPRLVVRRFNKNVVAQLIQYHPDGDKVLASAHSINLAKKGWGFNTGNIPASYLVGYMLGNAAKGKEAILDIGLHTPIQGSRIFAVLKGAADGGLKIKFSEEIFPPADRLSGKHIASYAATLKKDKEKFNKLFSSYIKNKQDPEKIQEAFEKTKEKISSSKNG